MKIQDLLFPLLKVVEDAAIAAHDFIGSGDQHNADAVAVEAMRNSLNNLAISGEIVIGEGERDEAPMLYIGEKLGSGGFELDIAVDPLEGTALCAFDKPGAIAILAAAPKGTLLNAPDLYMEKLAVSGIVTGLDLDADLSYNIQLIADSKNKKISELKAMVLERPRHEALVLELHVLGVKVSLFQDGDIAAVIAAADNEDDVDLYIGTGGAPEGVISAAICKVMNATFIGRLLIKNDKERERLKAMSIDHTLINRQLTIKDLVKGDVAIIATGVTSGNLLMGVAKNMNSITTESIIMHYDSSTISKIKTTKNIKNKYA